MVGRPDVSAKVLPEAEVPETVKGTEPVRLCFVLSTWQAVMLAASLAAAAKNLGFGKRTRTVVVLFLLEGPSDLGPWMGRLAGTLFPQAEIRWLKANPLDVVPEAGWPIDFDVVRRAIPLHPNEKVSELWLSQLHTPFKKLVMELFPEAAVLVFEDGLDGYISRGVGRPAALCGPAGGLRRIRWMLRGQYAAQMASHIACDWRVAKRHVNRVRASYLLLPHVLPVADYLRSRPIVKIPAETFREILQALAAQPEIRRETAGMPMLEVRRDVLLLAQPFHLSNCLAWSDEVTLLSETARTCVEKGYRVWVKEHPRAGKAYYSAMARDFGEDRLKQLPSSPMVPAEILRINSELCAWVGISSSTLFYGKYLLGSPVYSDASRWLAAHPDLSRCGLKLAEEQLPPLSELVSNSVAGAPA